MLIESVFIGGKIAKKLLGYFASRPSPSQGVDDLNTALGGLADVIMEETARAQEESIRFMKLDLMAYPSPRATSTYVRTYALRHGWEDAPVVSEVSSDGLYPTRVTNIENPVSYAGWVQRRSMQTRWNRYRWTTVEDVIERHSPMLIDKVIQFLTVVSRSF